MAADFRGFACRDIILRPRTERAKLYTELWDLSFGELMGTLRSAWWERVDTSDCSVEGSPTISVSFCDDLAEGGENVFFSHDGKCRECILCYRFYQDRNHIGLLLQHC